MKPSVGRVVHYILADDDAVAINRRRTNGTSIAERIKQEKWPLGAQAHIGNEVHEGDSVPMIVVKVHSETTISGQAFLDGNDTLWVTSAHEGTQPRCWSWPPRVE